MIIGVIASQINNSAKIWVRAIGTTYDTTYDGGSSFMACKTESELQAILTTAMPPNNYNVGYRVRVTHSWYDENFSTKQCTTYYFIIE